MIKENRLIRLRDGIKIHAQIKEVDGPVWVIITHGLGEHLGRHNYFLGLFSHNFNIFQYDLRGHGRSEGRRAYVKNFETYVEDLAEILDYIKNVFKGSQFVLFGHSMGALITAGYLQNKAPEGVYPQCVFLSAPPMMVPGVLGHALHCFPGLTRRLVRIPFSVPLGGLINLHKLSHDSRVFESYINDPLNCLKVHSHLLLGLIDYANKVFSRPMRAKCPISCAYGSEDAIIRPSAIRSYFANLGKEAEIHEVAGAYHEIHNEIAKFRSPYLQYLVKFISKTFYTTEE